MSDETPDLPDSGVEDFDAFWESQDVAPRTTTIMGRPVVLPDSLPLQFDMEARRLARSKRDKDVRRLVSILFGPDALEDWTRAGMTMHKFMVLLAWAPRVIAGENVTLAEVDADVRAEMASAVANATDEGKPDPT